MGDLAQAFSGILNRSVQEVTAALARDGRLFRCGLVGVNPHGDATLDRLFKVPRILGQRIASHGGPPREILSNLVVPLVQPCLALRDYHYMQPDTQLAQSWLAGALAEAAAETVKEGEHHGPGERDKPQRRGAHLLVSGAPGLGKTEWVRALLTEFASVTGGPSTLQAMEMVVLDADGTALSGEDRLSHLRLTMNMLRHSTNGVIVFDEADDVFRGQDESQSAGGDPSAARMANHRASLNRLIEDSRIPVVWIMNHPEILDPAVLRRFDTVIRFEGMPRSVRLSMLQQSFGDSTESAELVRWAEIAGLTPALIDRLAVVSRRAKGAGQVMDDAQCRHWLRQRLPGKATAHLKTVAAVADRWDANAVRASEDLLALAQGIGRCGSARLLLYGAPGTGKTAYAKALAQLLDKPLLEKRASDLLSPWVGETEQRIDRAFEAAIADDAILFIDEADSLLASREHAVRNWEVTQVNELLEQLSDFEGIVVLATNRLDALDDAVMRRVDAKIHFDVLTGDQLADGFVRMCEQVGVEYMKYHRLAAAKLIGLAPGDFACVRRRLRFAPLVLSEQSDYGDQKKQSNHDQAEALLDLLREELRMKTRANSPWVSMAR
jgi:transitional endoplasmic reticulum ATPase